MSKIIFDILLPPSNWDIQRYWAIGGSRLTKSDHTWNTWWEELFFTCRKLMISYLFCVLSVYISGNGILGAGVRKTWDVWENVYQLIIIWDPEGQVEDRGQVVNMCRMPLRLSLFRLELEYFMVSCGQEFETDLQFHNKLQQGPGPSS